MQRIKALKWILVALMGVITVRLFAIQIIDYDYWVAKANSEHTLLQTITAKRGNIYMMDGNEPAVVVLNQTVYNVITDPAMADLDKIQAVLEKYAKEYITADFDKLREMEGVRYYIIAKRMPKTVAEQVQSEGLSYIYFREENKRVYPEGDLASSLLGFVNMDGLGQYGVEGALNSRLKGEDGVLKTIADINKVALSIGDDNVKIPAIDGEDIVLTIDRNIQKKTEEVLVSAIAGKKATNAAAIIMDPTTGEIFSMASIPNYNPEEYWNVSDASRYINYVTEDPYEPASVCKTFAFAAAINEGVITPETTYRDSGSEVIDGFKVKNADGGKYHGVITMQTGFNNSFNMSSIYALKMMGGDENEITEEGREKFYDYLYNRFRFGRSTGIELYEASGILRGPNDGYAMNLTYANMTFGQGLSMNMIQLASAFSAVINGGYYMTPTVIKGTMSDGALVNAKYNEPADGQVITEESSAIMRQMLYNTRTSQRNRGIDPSGYYVGGKTGTAQVIIDGAYSAADGETLGSYIGFGGANGELPKYVIAIKIWGEDAHVSGTKDVMPAFNELSNYMIDYLKIQPK